MPIVTGAAMLERTEKDLIGERVADFLLHHAPERPRAEHRVVALRPRATRAPRASA